MGDREIWDWTQWQVFNMQQSILRKFSVRIVKNGLGVKNSQLGTGGNWEVSMGGTWELGFEPQPPSIQTLRKFQIIGWKIHFKH